MPEPSEFALLLVNSQYSTSPEGEQAVDGKFFMRQLRMIPVAAPWLIACVPVRLVRSPSSIRFSMRTFAPVVVTKNVVVLIVPLSVGRFASVFPIWRVVS
jgi:hypothetical protein